jgi:hypothetical protein
MKKRLAFVLLIGLPVAMPQVCAHATGGAAQFDRGAAAIDTDRSSQTASTLVVRGTIKSYDVTSRTLVLTTPSGTLPFTMPPAVRIRQRWHSIEISALGRYSGFRAAIRYSESGAEKTVQSVHIFGKDER